MLRGVRLLPLPYHSYFLPIQSDTLHVVYDEICKRSMKFIAISLVSSSQLINPGAGDGFFATHTGNGGGQRGSTPQAVEVTPLENGERYRHAVIKVL